MVGAGDRENSLGELTQTRTCRQWLGMQGVCGGWGDASAVQQATHCQRPVPEPGSRSPRRCTLSVCVDRQQSHSVQEKEACVSRPPTSQHRDGHPNGPFTGHPSLQSSNQLQFPPLQDPGILTVRPEVPPGLASVLPPTKHSCLGAGCWDPPHCSCSVSHPITPEAGLHSSSLGKWMKQMEAAVDPALFEIVTL